MADVSSAALSGKTPVSFLNGQWDMADATQQQNFYLLGPACKIHLAQSVQLFPAYCCVHVAMYYLLIAHLCM